MPFRTRDPVLTIEGSRMQFIDPQNPENLFGMWSVFSKCSGILENGRRLENLSWRVFAHETLCISPERRKPFSTSPSTTTLHRNLLSNTSSSIPELSSSVESTSSLEMEEVDEVVADINPRIARLSFGDGLSSADRRPRDKHITRKDLENLVTSIKDKQDLTRPISPLQMHSSPPDDQITPTRKAREESYDAQTHESAPTPRPSSPRPVESSTSTIASDNPMPSITSTDYGSETSADSDLSHSVVRGFRTGARGASTYRSQSQLALAPPPETAPRAVTEMPIPRKKGGMFQLGGSLTEDEASLRDQLFSQSHESDTRQAHGNRMKHASFLEKVTEIPKRSTFMLSSSHDDDNAIESDDEDDDAFESEEEEISESAIEDDDDWEDEAESEVGAKNLTFARVDSRPALTSRRSVITQGLHEGQRAAALQNAASRSTPLMRRSRTSTPNGPSMPATPDEQPPVEIRASPSTQSKPIDMSNSNLAPSCLPPLSPRATRRNMLSSELGISLRKHMLNERQQKNAGYSTTAAIQRRHTAHDMKNLTQYPEPGASGNGKELGSRNNSFNDYFDSGMGEYHQKGW